MAKIIRVLCLFGVHDYERQKWGRSDYGPTMLDCRTCKRCKKFQIYAYWEFRNRDIKDFDTYIIRPWTELEWTQYYAQDS